MQGLAAAHELSFANHRHVSLTQLEVLEQRTNAWVRRVTDELRTPILAMPRFPEVAGVRSNGDRTVDAAGCSRAASSARHQVTLEQDQAVDHALNDLAST